MFFTGGEVMGPMLRVSTRTWTRDSHDLFDYETQDPKQLSERHFASSYALRLLRLDSTVSPAPFISSPVDAHNAERQGDHLLTVVRRRPGEFTVAPPDRTSGHSMLQHRAWLVVRALPNKRYMLQEHDTVKLGRYRLRVKKIVTKQDLPNFDITSLLDAPVPELTSPVPDGMPIQCRICLSESADDDQLLCPCECKGSIKYVHAECMRRWMYLRSTKDAKDSDQPQKAALVCESTCELCKAPMPPFVRVKGKLVPLIVLPDMTHPFLLLENSPPHESKGTYFISFQDTDFVRLGRGHDASVRIADVSISRNHATIYYEDGKFFLEDQDSKFGTLVMMRRPMSIRLADVMAIQVGRSLIELAVDASLPFVSGCVDIPPLSGCFSFCRELNLNVEHSQSSASLVSVAATPVASTPQSIMDDSVATRSESQTQRSMVRLEPTSPLGRGVDDVAMPSERVAMPVFLPEGAQSAPLNDAAAFHNTIGSGALFGRHSWDSLYADDVSPHVFCSSRGEDPRPGGTSDGVAYLRLIMNTPSRNHLLRNLRYDNGLRSPNRIIPHSEVVFCPPEMQPRGFSMPSSAPNSASGGYFLPDSAFVNLEAAREISGGDTGTSALEGGRLSSTPVADNLRGVMQLMPLGSDPSPSRQVPK
ncbi:FHA domain containing protein, putative [Babesia caballi]|uniref:FHA domain containing protein, putative n=1 Tax=Babesia caballi TaxID=5871 RepID=A0AAV4LWD8_BABCB|nr:FHA domain containing protein, putative [Babesia caballi]